MGTALMQTDTYGACPYAVGDGFWTKNPENPSSRWPNTTWEQIKDVFLLSVGDKHSLDKTGGEEEHTLTLEECDRSLWSLKSVEGNGGLSYAFDPGSSYGIRSRIRTSPHNNMPPYLTRYYWERVS